MGMPHLNREAVEQLAAWFEHIASNTNPDDMCMPPDEYRSTAAWLQLHGIEAVDSESDIMPWNMPDDVADFYSKVWYASRLAALRVAQRESTRKINIDHREGKGPLFGGSGGW